MVSCPQVRFFLTLWTQCIRIWETRWNARTIHSGKQDEWLITVRVATLDTPTRKLFIPTWSTIAARSRDSSALIATNGTSAHPTSTNTLEWGTTDFQWLCIEIISYEKKRKKKHSGDCEFSTHCTRILFYSLPSCSPEKLCLLYWKNKEKKMHILEGRCLAMNWIKMWGRYESFVSIFRFFNFYVLLFTVIVETRCRYYSGTKF